MSKAPSSDSRSVYLDQDIWRRLEKPESEQSFFSAWLELQSALFSEVEGGVILVRQGEVFSPSACWPDDFKTDELVSEAAERTLETRRGVVLRSNKDSSSHVAVAYPVMVQGTLYGAVAMVVSPCEDSALQLLMRMVQWGIAWIENYFLRQAPESAPCREHHAGQALELLAMTLAQPHFDDAAQTLLNELTVRMACDKVSLAYIRKGRAHVCAVSHNVKIDRKMNLFGFLERAMDEAILQKETLTLPPAKTDRCITREHAAYAEHYGAGALLTLLLYDGSDVIGAVSFERTKASAFTTRETEFAENVLSLLAPVLDSKRQQDRHLILKVGDSLRSQITKLFGDHYPVRKAVVAGLLLAIVFLTFANGEYRVNSKAEIEGSVRRSIATPFDGYIAKANVRPGDRVHKGDVLCRMDDRDIQLERQKWQGKINQFSDQYHHALAQHDKSEISIAMAKIAQAKAQLDLIDQRLRRSVILAPFDGLIVSGDLSQAMGSAKRKGDVLFELTPLDSYRVLLQTSEKDIRYVQVGQVGELYLASFPGQSFVLKVSNITPVNHVLEGGNYFQVEAMLNTSPDMLRPGMKGVGKIIIGQRKLIWIWTHNLMDWIRLLLWSWWP